MAGLGIPRGRGQCRGFTLLEVILVLGVVVAALALMAPTLARLIQNAQVTATQTEAERIFRAIFGNPTRGEFGYLGDMGRLPTTLTELVEQGNQTPFHTADGLTEHVGGVGTGWRGPYLRTRFSTRGVVTDAWGQSFSYTDTGTTAGQIVSGGPDGDLATTADKITFPMHAPPTTGTLFVSVLVNRISDPMGATAKLYSAVDGEQTLTAIKKFVSRDTGFDGFLFKDVTHGLHVLVVAHTGPTDTSGCRTVSRAVPVTVVAGQQVFKEVRMLTDARVSVSSNPCKIPD